MKEIYIIKHPKSKDLIYMCKRRDCDGCCYGEVFSTRECAEKFLDGAYSTKHYKVEKIKLTPQDTNLKGDK